MRGRILEILRAGGQEPVSGEELPASLMYRALRYGTYSGFKG